MAVTANTTAPKTIWALMVAWALSGCVQNDLDAADRSELDNMWRGSMVPKSSPAQLIAAFDQYCRRPPDRSAAVDELRAAGYVALPHRAPGARAYVVDDRRPAVALSDRMCVVRALARSGQANRFASYVTEAFPGARATDPTPFGPQIERAWQIPGSGVIASARKRDVDFFTYTLIYYRSGVA